MTYYIARIDDENGKWVILDPFDSYSDAEMVFDSYCDMYPYAYVDIISSPE
jgi:hypothetical protein